MQAIPATKSSLLVPDDLSPGMWVTIASVPRHTEWEEQDDPELSRTSDWCYHLLKGIPLKVLAVSLPFVAVAPRLCTFKTRLPIDLRRARLMKVDGEYARAFKRKD